MLENAYKEEYVKLTKLYKDYLIECFEADIRLQELVCDKISRDYISYTILPIEQTDDLRGFGFQLVSPDGNIRKRDELLYEELYTICFGHIRSLYTRLVDFYNE